MQAGTIARGVNMGHAALHVLVRNDPFVLDASPDLFQSQSADVRQAAECIQNFIGMDAHCLSLLLEYHLFVCAGLFRVDQPGPGINRDSLPSEDLFDDLRHVSIGFVKDVWTSLDQRNPDAKPSKELRKFLRQARSAISAGGSTRARCRW